ncbi:MAG: hypothetical protein KGO23_14680, partial [Nitrospirota bacterium]|nr:hypothetical protein [Nitrospirota bacterium]
MRHTVTLSLLVLLIIPAILWAEDQLTSIPMPDPRISESTLITGTGWSDRGTRNESLACDLAQARAIQQIKKGIALSRSKGGITAEELSRAVPVTQERYWDAENGRCIVRMKLAVPSLEKPRK